MEEIFLTENITLINDKLYYENELIKNHNWHNYLIEFGWEKLNKKWITKLNTFLKKPSRNSQYGCLDCGGDGDCLFHCISFALNDYDENLDRYNSKNLRELISDSITENKFKDIISYYKIFSDSDDFDELWDPNTITFNEFKEKIKEGGNEYWGDNFLINIIKDTLNLNFFILYNNDITGQYYNYPLLYEYNPKQKSIILLYENENHFKLIGKFIENNMVYLFDNNTLPDEIVKLNNLIR